MILLNSQLWESTPSLVLMNLDNFLVDFHYTPHKILRNAISIM